MTTWWYVGGLGLFGVLFLMLATYITIPRIQAWWAWGMGSAAALFTLTAGAWLTKDTWLFHLAGWAIHLHPALGLILGLGAFFGFAIAILAVIPHVVSPRVAVTTGIAVLAFFLPTIVIQVNPPGKVGHMVTTGIFMVTGQADKITARWFG